MKHDIAHLVRFCFATLVCTGDFFESHFNHLIEIAKCWPTSYAWSTIKYSGVGCVLICGLLKAQTLHKVRSQSFHSCCHCGTNQEPRNHIFGPTGDCHHCYQHHLVLFVSKSKGWNTLHGFGPYFCWFTFWTSQHYLPKVRASLLIRLDRFHRKPQYMMGTLLRSIHLGKWCTTDFETQTNKRANKHYITNVSLWLMHWAAILDSEFGVVAVPQSFPDSNIVAAQTQNPHVPDLGRHYVAIWVPICNSGQSS